MTNGSATLGEGTGDEDPCGFGAPFRLPAVLVAVGVGVLLVVVALGVGEGDGVDLGVTVMSLWSKPVLKACDASVAVAMN